MKAQSTIIAELLILAITVSLAIGFVVATNSYFIYYAQMKKLASIYTFSIKNENWVNFTVIHSGGDTIDIFGHVYAIFKNGTSKHLSAYIVREGILLIDGRFTLSMFKFGEAFKVCVRLNGIDDAMVQLIISSQDSVILRVSEEV